MEIKVSLYEHNQNVIKTRRNVHVIAVSGLGDVWFCFHLLWAGSEAVAVRSLNSMSVWRLYIWNEVDNKSNVFILYDKEWIIE